MVSTGAGGARCIQLKNIFYKGNGSYNGNGRGWNSYW